MAHIFVSFYDDESGNNFELSKDYDASYIYDALNVAVDILKLQGFGEGLIEDFIGATYFSEDDAPLRGMDCPSCGCGERGDNNND